MEECHFDTDGNRIPVLAMDCQYFSAMMRHIHQKSISLVKRSAPWRPGEEYKPEDISAYGGVALGRAHD